MSVAKELKKLSNEPLDGIKVMLNEEDVIDVNADITGPDHTPFEQGVFKIKLVLPCDYPSAPPKGAHALARRRTLHYCSRTDPYAAPGYFLTRIYHPNISKTGEICVNTLKKDWQSSLGIGHVLQVVRCLLINPFPESALNEEAGKDFMEDYEEYCKKARMFTEVHARPSQKAESSSAEDTEGEPLEKKQKPVDSKSAEKRRTDKKKSLKRL